VGEYRIEFTWTGGYEVRQDIVLDGPWTVEVRSRLVTRCDTFDEAVGALKKLKEVSE
jgi:hypothetical protein